MFWDVYYGTEESRGLIKKFIYTWATEAGMMCKECMIKTFASLIWVISADLAYHTLLTNSSVFLKFHIFTNFVIFTIFRKIEKYIYFFHFYF